MSNPTLLTIGAEAEGILGAVSDHVYEENAASLVMARPLIIRPNPQAGLAQEEEEEEEEEGEGKEEDTDSDNTDDTEKLYKMTFEEWVHERIRGTVARNAGVNVGGQGAGAVVNSQNIHTIGREPLHYGWRVVHETTATIPFNQTGKYHPLVRYIGFELTTPTMQFGSKSLEEIARVYKCINEAFPPGPLIPETCGYHVHVGVGSERFSAHQMRRLACITYATGRLLTQLLPGHRKGNEHAKTNRYYSYLAHGAGADYACSVVRRKAAKKGPIFGLRGLHEFPHPEPAETYVDHGPLDFSWENKEAEKGKGKAVVVGDSNEDVEMEDTPRFTRLLERGSLPCEEIDRERWYYTGPSKQALDGEDYDPDVHNEEPLPVSIADAVDAVMRCPSAAAVAHLMRAGRLAVSFQTYYKRQKEYSILKPTIEFRQLAATFDADAACAWICVVAQLCRAALDWPWGDFNKLLRRCARGETHPEAYDVFDLLVDIGCPDEATLIQKMIIEGPPGSPFMRMSEVNDGAQ